MNMASIYERVLGDSFRQLHPQIQKRFGFSSRDRIAAIGYGVMKRIWFAKWAAIPLYVGACRHIMFPQGGRDISFMIENFAYQDQFGRETVTWSRTFQFHKQLRKFDATMIYSEERQGIVDYLGTKQHLAVDLAVLVEPNGGIRIRSGDQRFYERWLQFRFPRPFTGTADVCEWYDDESESYRISVEVTSPLLGPVFQYEGQFQNRFIEVDAAQIPFDVKPLREEMRE